MSPPAARAPTVLIGRLPAATLMATANYIIGTPGETRAEMAETMALHHEVPASDPGAVVAAIRARAATG